MASAVRLVLALLLAGAAPAGAQELTARVVGASAYVFRGLVVTSSPVLQPSLELTLGSGRASLTLGSWGNIEPADYDGVDEFSESAGVAGLTEVDYWAELSGSLGPAGFTAGVSAYTYPNDSGSVPADNTVEAYAGVELDVPLAPSLYYYHDVDEISGGYLELAIGLDVALGPRPGGLGATLGYSIGQGGDGLYFAENRFTHLDLAATTELPLGRFTLEPELHAVVAIDDATRVVTPLRQRGSWLWLGIGVSWSGGL